jgi:hypothetical protein
MWEFNRGGLGRSRKCAAGDVQVVVGGRGVAEDGCGLGDEKLGAVGERNE